VTYEVRNPGPVLGEEHRCGGVKPINVMMNPNPSLLIHNYFDDESQPFLLINNYFDNESQPFPLDK
jgi:hypothetical protein